MTLYDFVSEMTSDDHLLKVASAIPSEVNEICMDTLFTGMELKLMLTGKIAHYKALPCLEIYLHKCFRVNHVRIYICNIQSEEGRASLDAISCWLAYVLKQRMGMDPIVNGITYSDDGLNVELAASCLPPAPCWKTAAS